MSLARPLSTVAVVALTAAPAFAQAAVVSTFDADNDGWTTRDASGTGATSAAVWDSVNQRLTTGDIYGWHTYNAPGKFLGDQSAFYGQSLSFDMGVAAKNSDANNYFTALIASGSNTLIWFGGSPSTSGITSFSALLTEAAPGWRYNSTLDNPASGTAPTQAEFQAVLGNITRMQFDADWLTGPDTVTLDNVALGTLPVIPEPQTYVLLALGLAGVLAAARRRRG